MHHSKNAIKGVILSSEVGDPLLLWSRVRTRDNVGWD